MAYLGVLSSEDRDGCVWLLLRTIRELLAWFPTEMGLQDGLCVYLGFLVRPTRWLETGTIFSNKWGFELSSLHGGAAEPGPGPTQLVSWGHKSIQSVQ